MLCVDIREVSTCRHAINTSGKSTLSKCIVSIIPSESRMSIVSPLMTSVIIVVYLIRESGSVSRDPELLVDVSKGVD